MEILKNLEELKKKLINDMISCITYVPNRQTDIYTMMNTYKSDLVAQEPDEKEIILKNLANCINGEPYDKPQRVQEIGYTATEVSQVSQILDDLIENLANSTNLQLDCDNANKEIHVLNESKGYALLDTWRRELIYEITEKAKEYQPEQSLGMQMTY